MRFFFFDEGGDALSALQSQHVQVIPGDSAEAAQSRWRRHSPVTRRFFDWRLGAELNRVAKVRKQSADRAWPTVRGLNLSARNFDETVRSCESAFRGVLATPEYPALLEKHGLLPVFSLFTATI